MHFFEMKREMQDLFSNMFFSSITKGTAYFLEDGLLGKWQTFGAESLTMKGESEPVQKENNGAPIPCF